MTYKERKTQNVSSSIVMQLQFFKLCIVYAPCSSITIICSQLLCILPGATQINILNIWSSTFYISVNKSETCALMAIVPVLTIFTGAIMTILLLTHDKLVRIHLSACFQGCKLFSTWCFVHAKGTQAYSQVYHETSKLHHHIFTIHHCIYCWEMKLYFLREAVSFLSRQCSETWYDK